MGFISPLGSVGLWFSPVWKGFGLFRFSCPSHPIRDSILSYLKTSHNPLMLLSFLWFFFPSVSLHIISITITFKVHCFSALSKLLGIPTSVFFMSCVVNFISRNLFGIFFISFISLFNFFDIWTIVIITLCPYLQILTTVWVLGQFWLVNHSPHFRLCFLVSWHVC